MSSPSRSLRPVGLAGIGWGALLLWRGPTLFRRVQGRIPSSSERDAITVLGVRHAMQGLAQLLVPHHFGRLYAAIDGVHAASMVAVAVVRPARRRAAMLSAAVAAASGLASVGAGGR